MMHDPSYIKELFSRFMAGRCSPDEIDILTAYLEEAGDDELLPSVEEFREAYPELSKMDPGATDRVFRRLNAVMKQDAVIRELPEKQGQLPTFPRPQGEPRPASDRQLPMYRRPRGRWIPAAAAAVLLIAVSAVLYLSYMNFIPDTYTTGNAQISNLELEDGTKVTLNANSELKVKLSPGIREVWLDGEAFFRVAHDDTKKFVVHTSEQFSVEVLGTEFNVKDRSEGTSVVLNKGSVKVKLRHGEASPEELFIKPGEMVEYKPADESLSKSRVDTVKYSSWKQNLLIFDETPLAQVAQTIENQFGYSVTFESGSLADLRFTGSSPADDLDMLLETLERSFGLSIAKTEQEIRISSAFDNSERI